VEDNLWYKGGSFTLSLRLCLIIEFENWIGFGLFRLRNLTF